MSGRNPTLYCTLALIAMQGHQTKTDTMSLDYSSVGFPAAFDCSIKHAPQTARKTYNMHLKLSQTSFVKDVTAHK